MWRRGRRWLAAWRCRRRPYKRLLRGGLTSVARTRRCSGARARAPALRGMRRPRQRAEEVVARNRAAAGPPYDLVFADFLADRPAAPHDDRSRRGYHTGALKVRLTPFLTHTRSAPVADEALLVIVKRTSRTSRRGLAEGRAVRLRSVERSQWRKTDAPGDGHRNLCHSNRVAAGCRQSMAMGRLSCIAAKAFATSASVRNERFPIASVAAWTSCRSRSTSAGAT